MSESLSLEQRIAELEQIAAAVRVCDKCPLATQGRKKPVPGAGKYDAEILFIGEGPGFHEDQQGLPFVGPSGHLLDEFLKLIGMDRQQVFITNVVKCRPPENRDPIPLEVETCTTAYLYRQIELINPKVIATLGRFSMGLFFPKAKITQIHGQPKWDNGRYYLPLFHPAAILRNVTMRPQAEDDFRKIPNLLKDWEKRMNPQAVEPTKAAEPPKEPDSPTQLSLF